jgi:hypothetical protein
VRSAKMVCVVHHKIVKSITDEPSIHREVP